jgi:hypothetical protein
MHYDLDSPVPLSPFNGVVGRNRIGVAATFRRDTRFVTQRTADERAGSPRTGKRKLVARGEFHSAERLVVGVADHLDRRVFGLQGSGDAIE